MSANGRNTATSDGHVLHWSGRVLTADDLRGNLNGHHELVLAPGTVVTPLAAEELRNGGIAITRRPTEGKPVATWGVAQDRQYPAVKAALQSMPLRELAATCIGPECDWARTLAECVARGDCCGGVVFCQDVSLICCVANKLPGLRAAAVITVVQAARAALTLGVNLLAVEMPGRTFFEVRQILRNLCRPACPDGVACTLGGLDGHAHR
jgi:hypothetical protein